MASTCRYLRWTITARRGGDAFNGVCQAADFELRNGSTSIPWPVGADADNPGGDFGAFPEEAIRLLDDDPDTKWVDLNFTGDSDPNTTAGLTVIIIDASEPLGPFDGYRYRTGSDLDGRDPVTWTLEGSHNGTDWTLIDTVTGATIPTGRGSWTDTFTLDADIPPPYEAEVTAYRFGADVATEGSSWLGAESTPITRSKTAGPFRLRQQIDVTSGELTAAVVTLQRRINEGDWATVPVREE